MAPPIFKPTKIAKAKVKRTSKGLKNSAKSVKRSLGVKRSWNKRKRKERTVAGEAAKGFARHGGFSLALHGITTGVAYGIQRRALTENGRVPLSDREKQVLNANVRHGLTQGVKSSIAWGTAGAGVYGLAEKLRKKKGIR